MTNYMILYSLSFIAVNSKCLAILKVSNSLEIRSKFIKLPSHIKQAIKA